MIFFSSLFHSSSCSIRPSSIYVHLRLIKSWTFVLLRIHFLFLFVLFRTFFVIGIFGAPTSLSYLKMYKIIHIPIVYDYLLFLSLLLLLFLWKIRPRVSFGSDSYIHRYCRLWQILVISIMLVNADKIHVAAIVSRDWLWLVDLTEAVSWLKITISSVYCWFVINLLFAMIIYSPSFLASGKFP